MGLTLLGALAAAGCGDSVSLGNEVQYWYDGDAAHGGSTTEPLSLYEGTSSPSIYAVDDTTLFTTFGERDQKRGESLLVTVKSCELASCAGTLRTLYEQLYPSVIDAPSVVLAVGGSEIFFASRDSLGGSYIVACPRSGCTHAPRQVVSVRGQAKRLVATDAHVYWDDGSSLWRCAREGCTTPATRNLDAVARPPIGGNFGMTSFTIADEYAYVVGPGGLARLKADLSSDPDWVYRSELPIRGIAARGDWIYFGISTLTGEIRRCPVTGCVGDPEGVASGQHWPSWLAVDDRTLYWFNFISDPGPTGPGSLGAAATDGPSEPRTLLSDLPLDSYMPIAMNAHHLYWMEIFNNRLRLRTLAK